MPFSIPLTREPRSTTSRWPAARCARTALWPPVLFCLGLAAVAWLAAPQLAAVMAHGQRAAEVEEIEDRLGMAHAGKAGERHPLLAYPLSTRGEMEVAAGRRSVGLADLRLALELRSAAQGEVLNTAYSQLALAKALARGGRAERAEALELARKAEPPVVAEKDAEGVKEASKLISSLSGSTRVPCALLERPSGRPAWALSGAEPSLVLDFAGARRVRSLRSQAHHGAGSDA